jgi:hypothetical protein
MKYDYQNQNDQDIGNEINGKTTKDTNQDNIKKEKKLPVESLKLDEEENKLEIVQERGRP